MLEWLRPERSRSVLPLIVSLAALAYTLGVRPGIFASCVTFTLSFGVWAFSQTTPPASDPTNKTQSADTVETVFKVGGDVTPPHLTYSPEPEYSKIARKKKYQGTCVLAGIVGTDGLLHDIEVTRSLGMGLDEKAIEAVKKWKFDPAHKEGKAVAAKISVQVNFRLY
jgi:TonB family protein